MVNGKALRGYFGVFTVYVKSAGLCRRRSKLM